MNRFSLPRFRRVLANDFLQQWKRIWIATLALAGIGLIAYLTNVDPEAAARPELYIALLPAVLFIGGFIFTSTIFSDLHHPLQRFQYLTMPCSNLERFVSRYLLSGPLYCLYVLIVYTVFDWMASLIAQAAVGASGMPFSPFEPRIIELVLTYLWLHAFVFGGAIYFRSHQLIKTLVASLLIGLGLLVVGLVAARIVFWDHFTGLLHFETEAGMNLLFLRPLVLQIAGFISYLWVLFIAFLCLREHEVQGEL